MVEQKKVAARESARPITVDKFDATAGIVVVGSGAGGMTAALFGRWLGNDVVVLEKAPELGGTSRKSAYWFWIPNNEPMRAMGIQDPLDGFLRLVARLSRLTRYDPSSPTFG
jgi:heterodisulfide reductase subunit A-like polyferredoxin